MQILNLRAGIGFTMGRGRNWRVVHPEMGAKQLTLNHSTPGPGHEFPQHIHDESEDVFVILEGSVSVRQGDVYTPIRAGEAAFIPVGEVHGTVNHATEAARLISFQSPPDMALYRGERDKPPAETPKPPTDHESGVQIIDLARGGPVFGRVGEWRLAVSPRNGAKHLIVHYIRLGAGEKFAHDPEPTEVIYVVLSGRLVVEGVPGESFLAADGVLFLAPGDSLRLRADNELVTLIRTQAQA